MKRILIVTFVWIAFVWAAAFAFGPGTEGTGVGSSPLDRWDAAFYRGHATGSPVDRQDAFPPLYGWIVGAGMRLTGLHFGITSALVSAILTIGTVSLLAAALNHSQDVRRSGRVWAIIVFLSSPAAFSLLAPYPTSLLAFLAGVSWLGLLRRRIWLTVIPASLAPLAHPTGLAISLATLAVILSRRRFRDSILALTFFGAGAAIFISSGLLDRLIEARTGFSLFPGVPFWNQGSWYLATAELVIILATVVTGGMLALAFWQRPRSAWPTLSSIGLFLITVVSGAWTGLARYLIPAFGIPQSISRLSNSLKALIVLAGLALQFWWLREFVHWQAYV